MSFFNIFMNKDTNRNTATGSHNFTNIDFDPAKIINSIFKTDSNLVKKKCVECDVKFNLIRKKKICKGCAFEYCSTCFLKETSLGNSFSPLCLKCRVFSRKPLKKEDLMRLRVKELKWFLRSRRISLNFCKEKSDLVDLILQNFEIRNNQSNPGPSRTNETDNIQNIQRNSSSPQTSSDSSPLRRSQSFNQINSDNVSSVSETLDSDWEVLNERFSSVNDSSINSPNDNVNLPTSQNSFENINQNLNSDIENNSSVLNRNDEALLNNTENNTNSSLNLNERLEPNLSNAENNSRRTASTSRLQNPNISNLSNNLSESSESLNNFKPFNIEDVKSEEEIHNLSVRQLKLVLTRNYVNYKGCCEKEELVDKSIRLWKQVKKDQEVAAIDEKEEEMCKICMENVINCVLLECGHYVTCLDCGKRLNECPICRQYVVRTIRIFKS